MYIPKCSERASWPCTIWMSSGSVCNELVIHSATRDEESKDRKGIAVTIDLWRLANGLRRWWVLLMGRPCLP